jgi:hypothetical protein
MVVATYHLWRMEPDHGWGPIDLDAWENVPCLSGRVAVESDVKTGRAVFHIQQASLHEPLNISLPQLAYVEEKECGVLVVAIQAERADAKRYVGYRYVDGGNGVALVEELVFISPDGEPREAV